MLVVLVYLAEFQIPWDKLIGPIVTVGIGAIVKLVRDMRNAAERIRENSEQVPTLVADVAELKREVKAAHTEANQVGTKFAAFAADSSADRQRLREGISHLADQQQVTTAVIEGVAKVGEGLHRIADRLDNSLPARVPDGPPRRLIDPPRTDWRDQRRREPYGADDRPDE
jgi:hypothetical protein